jgi:hypothetical protein
VTGVRWGSVVEVAESDAGGSDRSGISEIVTTGGR